MGDSVLNLEALAIAFTFNFFIVGEGEVDVLLPNACNLDPSRFTYQIEFEFPASSCGSRHSILNTSMFPK
jgi:hypothetical protein